MNGFIKGKTILVVDDTPSNLGVMFDFLEEQGCNVYIASDGEKALQSVERSLPDIVLLDIMMPGMDGVETCRRLKKSDSVAKDTPVIFMTALSDVDDKVRGFEAGAVDYITKPPEPEEVLARVSTHLQIRALTKRLEEQNLRLTALYKEKENMVEELAQLNRDKDKFFSIISHDLRGPFTALKGFSHLLWQEFNSEEGVTLEDTKMMAQSIYNSSEAAVNLLENLLDWSRSQLGRMVYRPAKTKLPQVVELALGTLAQMAEAKQIKLVNNTPNLLVCIDENMIGVVLRNLISNAIKFTPMEGQVSVLARVGNRQWVEVEVRDTGVGISSENQARLFDIGTAYTTDGTEKEKGAGMGLMMCQEMVEKHGGTIRVESAPGKGTDVIFTIPLAGLKLRL